MASLDTLTPHLSKIKIPAPQQLVYKDECVYSFDNPENGKTPDNTNSLEALRSNFEIPENHNIWYIVTDSNVLLHNLHVLNNILNADKQCRLMVPQQVMKKIQNATNSRLRLLAHKTLYFILSKVEANLAIIDKSSEEIDNSNDDILNCCTLNIARENHVVLLTDDIELHNNSNTSNMHIFAVSEIKHLLEESQSDEIPTNNFDTVGIARDRNIKITINNETNIRHDDDASVSLIKEDTHPEIGEGTCEKLLKINKKVCDVGVQADSASLPKICEDINNEIILPDSTKANFLRMKSDEWVSRLVQIMEEALTQILRLEPSGTLEHMPPPWTVHEATECIKKGFHYDSDVVDAANKFLQISFENGGLRGKIKSSIKPNKFMELYSFGVYLIDALQGALVDNEDLQTAAESLSKLLNDIQEPQLDPSNQDSFNDITVQENETKVAEDNGTTKGTVSPDKNKETESPKVAKKNKSPTISPGKYNLRSQIKKPIEVNQDVSGKVSVTRNVDTESSFFSSLYLKKNSNLISDSEITIKDPNLIIGLGTSDEIKEKNGSPSLHKNEENVNTADEFTPKLVNEDPKMNEPQIIRKFSICPKYEDRFKSKSKFISDVGGDSNKEFEGSVINYEEEDFEDDYYGTDEYHVENEYYDMDDNDVEWPAFGTSPEKTEGIGRVPTSNYIDIISKNESLTFKRIMEKFEKDIQRAYSSIQDFCVKSCESLQTPDFSAEDKTQMQLRAEKTYTYIHQICHQLNSVLTRENSDQGISEILKRKEFKDIEVEENDMEVYRNFIGNCLEQGKVLMDSITLVLEASKEETG
ncbi:uncharacterized protein LOC120636780 [Pararge aegeria]|uniref:uncharacterized protein LOC120636780 n=1 Tax=Pararge aegeria TaxID=116150 RepID=UPI0019D08E3A|nr:uncharacterized protein LOC120636780 [Pararge aegeria]